MPKSPGPLVGEIEGADTGENEVVVLNHPPHHLRKISNRADPIQLEDESDEEGHLTQKRKRQHNGLEITDSGMSSMVPSPFLNQHRAKQYDRQTPSLLWATTEASAAGPSRLSPIPRNTSTSVAHPSPANLLPRVLEILPDIAPEYTLEQLTLAIATLDSDRAVTRVVEVAVDMAMGYPKTKTRNKGKGKAKDAGTDYSDIAYRSDERRGEAYSSRAQRALENQFRRIPIPHIRSSFAACGSIYAPTFISLQEQSQSGTKPYDELKNPRRYQTYDDRSRKRIKGNSESDVRQSPNIDAAGQGESEFELEEQWLQSFLRKQHEEHALATAKKLAFEEAIAKGEGIECGCCFGEDIPQEMFQCADGHLFCRDCSTRHSEIKLGEQSLNITCMDMSGCEQPFPESELKRLLSTKSFDLFNRLKLSKDLELAGIDGLESCPGCDFAAIILDQDDKLFRCEKEGCRMISCRKCKREASNLPLRARMSSFRLQEHLPKSCEEMEADRKLNKRHTVEDAMSEALIRRCPNILCRKPFVKESGCNNIKCSSCGTLSCYVCKKAVDGYQHFDRSIFCRPNVSQAKGAPDIPGVAASTAESKLCPLWDTDDHQAIIDARDAAQRVALAEAEEEGLAFDAADLTVAAPHRVSTPNEGLHHAPDLGNLHILIDMGGHHLFAAQERLGNLQERYPARLAGMVNPPHQPRPAVIRAALPRGVVFDNEYNRDLQHGVAPPQPMPMRAYPPRRFLGVNDRAGLIGTPAVWRTIAPLPQRQRIKSHYVDDHRHQFTGARPPRREFVPPMGRVAEPSAVPLEPPPPYESVNQGGAVWHG